MRGPVSKRWIDMETPQASNGASPYRVGRRRASAAVASNKADRPRTGREVMFPRLRHYLSHETFGPFGSMLEGVMRNWWMLAAVAVATLGASAGPSDAQQTIRVGWTIPAEESKYWMMKRP